MTNMDISALAEVEEPSDQEAIAIVGMACRFPGEAEDIESFWRLLSAGGMTVTEVPRERWDCRRFYSSNPETPGRVGVKYGNFLRQDIQGFDAGFFGISPREAEVMDPQQRLLLEVAWEAIEHAGADLSQMNALRTGVYMGAFTLDNLIGRMGGASRFLTGPHTAVGSTATILSNRISHAFNLTGPSLSVDTACSSSLVAFHLACQALRQGDCDIALAGGVNVMLRPEYVIAMSKGHFLSPDGRSKTFDASGDGYGRGEGAGVVILKPLSHARANGDQILALVRATGCNQDGRTDGITVPSGEAQRTLIATVLARAGMVTSNIHYVEAHGTGTAVGDPIETNAIGSVLGIDRDSPLPVGSVKANIGHLEAASGVAGLIKLVLCMRERQLPPVAGLTTLNPAIDFVGLNLLAPRSLMSLPQGNLRMAINSFGYGGTNAHAILESAPAAVPLTQDTQVKVGLLPISARSEESLTELVKRWGTLLADKTQPLRPLIASAALRRSHHDHRVAFVGGSHDELIKGIESWLGSKPRIERPLRDSRVVFVYTGMGPQWWGMARELLTGDPDSQIIAEEFDNYFCAVAGWSLVEELLRPEAESRVSETIIAQTGNLLCQVLVTEWLRARGITPAAMLGHSVGEVSTAWASGALSLKEAIFVSYQRAYLQSSAAGQGGMLAIGMAEADARALIDGYGDKIEIAAINGPGAVTLAGDTTALEELAGRLEVRGVFARRLRVEVAYHSRFMDPILDPLRANLADLKPSIPRVPTWSTVSAREEKCDLFDAKYWCRNVREPVRFRAAIEDLYDQGYRLFLEIGPHSVLGGNIHEILSQRGGEGRTLSTLARNHSDFAQLYGALARLYAAGLQPNWRKLNSEPDASLVLPSHPWFRETLWSEAESCARERLGPLPGPLCGEYCDQPTPTWERPLNTLYLPWVLDHVVDNLVLLPAAAFVDTMLAVAGQVYPGEGALCIEHMSLQRPLIFDGDRTVLYRTSHDTARNLVQIASRDEAGSPWTQHVEARIGRVMFDESDPPVLPDGAHELDVTELYERFQCMGLLYGPACQRIQHIQISGDYVRAELTALDDTPADIEHFIHPTLLDATFQALLAIVLEQGDTPWVPIGIEGITLRHRIEGDLICLGHVRIRSKHEVVGDLWIMDTQGDVLAHIDGVRCVPINQTRDPLHGLFFREHFDILPPLGEPLRLGAWLLLCEDGCTLGSLGETLARDMVRVGVKEVVPYAVGSLARNDISSGAEITTMLEGPIPSSLNGVVYLSAVGDSSPEQVRERVSRVHALIIGLSKRDLLPRVYFVTHDAQAAILGDEVKGHAQAAIHGYGRVAHNEYPAMAITMIDHDDSPAARYGLLAELLGNDIEDDVALRGDLRLGRRIRGLDPHTMHEEAISPCISDPDGVELCTGKTGEHFWRQTLPPQLNNDQILLVIHTLVREETGDYPLCGFIAQVLTGNPTLPSGTWLVSATNMNPASHLLINPENLTYIPLLYPQAGLERLVSFWAGLHAAWARLPRPVDGGPLLLFGSKCAEGHIIRALAPLFGFTHIVDADEYYPRMRGIAGRLTRLVGSRGVSLVIFADTDGLAPQVLPLAAGGQVICLGAACEMDVSRWTRGVVGVGIHRIDPLALFHADPIHIRESLATLGGVLENVTGGIPIEPNISAATWVDNHARVGQSVVFNPLPAAVPRDAARFEAYGTWLITGGFGGFGLACAEWLAQRGVHELILVSRSGARGPAATRVANLEAAGIRIRSVQADITDADAMNALCSEIASDSYPLVGVLHAAGVLADMTIHDMSEEDLQRVLIPKIDGAWRLSEALEANLLEPRHFILFSSVAASVGNTRQANYVAANVSLDAFAAWRRARGLAADCIAWGPLGFGMGTSDESLSRHFEGMGMQPLNTAQTMVGLERVLAEHPGSLILASINWPRWGQFDPFGARSPRVAQLTEKSDEVGDSPLKVELAGMDISERAEMAVLLLAEALSAPLKMTAERIDAGRLLADLGVDSLLAVEIQVAIRATFGVEFSTLELMRGNTVSSLAMLVLERMGLHPISA